MHSKAQDRPATVPQIQTEHAAPPHSVKPPTRPQESVARHDDQQEESGKGPLKSRRKKVSWVDDTDYDYLEPETRPPRRIAQNDDKRKVVDVIDVDGDCSEDDWLPRKAPPAKRKRKAK